MRKRPKFEAIHGRGEPALLAEAYSLLTPSAFAAWVRLMVEPGTRALVSRRNVARLLGLSFRAANAILRELYLKGFVCFDKVPGRATTGVILERRAMLVGRDQFIKLSGAPVDCTLAKKKENC